ncbi:transposable element Tcb1 transposase [Trichonephila clavipes]|uniref:Transposable element Tcb1 transposase n=1 Tax=Trichonephila clavipes TaxID=2585209 RepID=A0A8X6SLH1_TRICX|nr:transposable element Tcb1 transposase [Trichonephila clavipes]
MATGSYMTPTYSRSQSEVQGDLHKGSAFDQVSEFDRGRIVAYRDCGLSFREIGSRVGRNQTTVMRICDQWMQEATTDRCSRSWNEVVFTDELRFCLQHHD